jgi:hypothetical protein
LAQTLRSVLVSMSNQGHAGQNQTLDCPPGTAYDEDAFRYFLDIERARAGRSDHAIRLLFTTFEQDPGKPLPISPASAASLFESLRLSLRETDIMGWYRQGRVAGAVLSARAGAAGPGMWSLIEQRVGDGLRQRLPLKVARTLRVRVMQLGPQRSRVA